MLPEKDHGHSEGISDGESRRRVFSRQLFYPQRQLHVTFAVLDTMMRGLTMLLLVTGVLAWLSGCAEPLPWPESPLYSFPESVPGRDYPETQEAAMRAIEGHYAHFDVVAYADPSTRTPMRTFIVSYGFTEFRIENGKLLQIDRFCHAEQLLNQRSVEIEFSAAATRAIAPRAQEVELRLEGGLWHVYRPASPTLLGIDGDPSLPLSTDPDDPNFTDPDNDGHPGVTVKLTMGRLFKGELYIARREIYRDHLVLHTDGSLYGSVEDESEQFVIGASRRILKQQSNQVQLSDPGMNPIILIPIDKDLDTCEELMARRDELFPESPSFR